MVVVSDVVVEIVVSHGGHFLRLDCVLKAIIIVVGRGSYGCGSCVDVVMVTDVMVDIVVMVVIL